METVMGLLESFRAWRDEPLTGATRASMRMAYAKVAATTRDAALAIVMTALMAASMIGWPALVWALLITPWVLWPKQVVRLCLAMIGAREESQAHLALDCAVSVVFHALWAAIGGMIWWLAPQGLHAIGFVAVAGLLAHVSINDRRHAAQQFSTLIGPIAVIAAMMTDAVVRHGEWQWPVGAGAMLVALGAVMSEHRRTTKALERARRQEQDSLALWELAGRGSKAGMWDYCFATGAINWSHSLTLLAGCDTENYLKRGGDFAALSPPDWREKVNHSYRTARDGGALEWSMEYPIERPDGELVWVEHHLSFERDSRGEPQRIIGFVQDVTQRRAAERAALEASQAKSTFLASFSHEVRTPMNAVMGLTELLAREPLPPTARQHVETLREVGHQLLSLLNDVLDLSKIEAGKMTLERLSLSPAEMIRQMERMWRPQFEDKGLTFQVHIAEGIPDQIVGDPVRLRQIITNLLSNAAKFTAKGQIILRLESRGSPGPDATLAIRVQDTGIGLSDAQRARLFSAYAQADQAIARQYGGTGLGLAISQRLANEMGGQITVDSEFGHGSAFTLLLPLEPAAVSDRDQGGAVVAAAADTLDILFAEDHPVNQRIGLAFLAPFGHRVTVVENGEAAVRAAQEAPFDVILMDINMPVMDGLAATRAIRAGKGPNAATPIIALTANALNTQREEGFAAGLSDYLAKPFDPRALITAICANVARQRQLAA
jgi:PAS domain S-box-containing protein